MSRDGTKIRDSVFRFLQHLQTPEVFAIGVGVLVSRTTQNLRYYLINTILQRLVRIPKHFDPRENSVGWQEGRRVGE